ncbi:class E sortase [Streptomyces sp. H27-C3]|uniref:class E sortase n=1 Tax=Streptomyces sp. H27-C3 TaxID=3046305 RepID=UPI0024BA1E62|nr:class E sortase [Streptomyces sp. H27-C3]MDJ0462052.1 class E sortase [Streptomyces sp. H27-C3]
MTELRPEHDAGQEGPYEQVAYEAGAAAEFEAAVDRLADPLNDPLPGGEGSPWFQSSTAPMAPQQGPQAPSCPLQPEPQQSRQHQQPQQQPYHEPQEWYDPEGYRRDWYGRQQPAPMPAPMPVPAPGPMPPERISASAPMPPPTHAVREGRGAHEGRDDETVGLLIADTRRTPEPGPPPPPGGRAERRRAAKGRGRRPAEPGAHGRAAGDGPAPLSRLEARRAVRAGKDGPAVVASRFLGELFITVGVLMLLFVTYQLWWTNVLAQQQANGTASSLESDWANGRRPGAFEPGKGFAIMHIPKLDVKVPVAEGISKPDVLDRGMVGHYAEGKLKTAMPSDKQGNFAVAGHRNTHGEPFRYINRLKPGDAIVVETQDTYYTYEMASILPQTTPRNVAVLRPVPLGSGFTGPGRYVTLTTCTPEFTSTYRMIVWGKMVDERPRSKGRPDALVG